MTRVRTSFLNMPGVVNLISLANIYSGDVSQAAKGFFRQVTATPADRLVDYGARWGSFLPNALVRYVISSVERVFFDIPLVDSTLELDKLPSQAHLSHFNLPANPARPVSLSDWPALSSRITDSRFGGRSEEIWNTLAALDKQWVKDESGHWIEKAIAPDEPIINHMRYMLDWKDYLKGVINNAEVHNVPLPHFSPHITAAEKKEVVDKVLCAVQHWENVGLNKYLQRGQNLLNDLAGGRFYDDVDLAARSLHKTTYNLNIFKSLKPNGNKIERNFLRMLLLAVEPEKDAPNPKGLKALAQGVQEYFGLYKPPHQRVIEHLDKTFIKSLNGPLTPEYLEQFLTRLHQAQIKIGNRVIPFRFDDKQTLGLGEKATSAQIKTISHQLCEHVSDLSTFLKNGHQELLALKNTVPKANHAASLEALGKTLQAGFNQRMLNLASTFTGKNEAAPLALKEIIALGPDHPTFKLLQDGIKNLPKPDLLRRITKVAFWPQIALSAVVTLCTVGLLRSWIDQVPVQRYQDKIVAQKGDVKGATLAYSLGLVAAIGSMFGFARSHIFQNRLLPVSVGTAALGITTMVVTTIGAMTTLMNLKPDKGLPKPNSPLEAVGLLKNLWPPYRQAQEKAAAELKRLGEHDHFAFSPDAPKALTGPVSPRALLPSPSVSPSVSPSASVFAALPAPLPAAGLNFVSARLPATGALRPLKVTFNSQPSVDLQTKPWAKALAEASILQSARLGSVTPSRNPFAK